MDVGLRPHAEVQGSLYICSLPTAEEKLQGTYRRDIKKMDDYKHTKAIRIGNSCAHDGDAVGDAFLFKHGHMTDGSLYRELYGLDPSYVRQNKPKQA